MEKITVNGKEVTTNINSINRPRLKESMNVRRLPFGMTEQAFLEELVEQGFTRVTFYEMPTAVRGWHNVYANCKR